jgi:hypothetical protein
MFLSFLFDEKERIKHFLFNLSSPKQTMVCFLFFCLKLTVVISLFPRNKLLAMTVSMDKHAPQEKTFPDA